MVGAFDYFVIFAEMRTGSNLLEATLGQIDGLACHGEAFNPEHIGNPKNHELFGMTMADRLKDPMELLRRIRGAKGFNGFRFFCNHEPRVLDAILNDPRCAKIVLTRNPVDCYISLKIAYNTKRWKLTDVKDKIAWKSPFKPVEFEEFLSERQSFQRRLLNALQVSGQTAFYLDYEDSLNVDVLNGLVRYLGFSQVITKVSDQIVRQNPEEMADKVRNFAEMEAALARIDWANLSRTPNFEPRRGPGIPRVIASRDAPLLYVPILPLHDAHLRVWLGSFGTGGLEQDFTQKTLRTWKRKAAGHRSFVVVRHPVTRAYDSFCSVLSGEQFADIRDVLRNQFNVSLPPDSDLAELNAQCFGDALIRFLKFVTVNLNGQTGVRQDVHWASQWSILKGISDFAAPDLICREDTLERDLTYLIRTAGLKKMPPLPVQESSGFADLARVYSTEVENAVKEAYQRDYMTFGFSNWKPDSRM